MTTPRRSRLGWSDDMTSEPPPEHPCRLPRWVRLSLFGLVAAVLLSLAGVGLLATYVYQQQQYIQGRGEYRDAEAARIEADNVERTRAALCDLLDTFPAGVPALERARVKYQCGPGIPVELLTPEEQARIAERATPSPQPAAVQPPTPEIGSPAVVDPPRPAPNTPTPTTSPVPDPTVDLGPVTDLVCDLAGVCI